MNTTDNYTKKWEAIVEEYDAKAARLDAEERLRYDAWNENMQEQFDAMGDWTESAWDEFTAKAEQMWNDVVIGLSDKEDSDEQD